MKSGGTQQRGSEAGMCPAPLLRTDKTREQPTCPAADGQTANMGRIKVMATNRSEALTQATTWKNLEHVMLSGRRHRDHIQFNVIYTECPDQAHRERQQVNWQLLGAGVEGEARGGGAKGHGGFRNVVTEMFPN